MIEKEWINNWQSKEHFNKKQLMFNIVVDTINTTKKYDTLVLKFKDRHV